MIELPHIILTLNPALLLINSPIEEAVLIEELKTLHGDNWSSMYTEIKAKKRLERLYSSINNNNKEVCNISNTDKKICNISNTKDD